MGRLTLVVGRPGEGKSFFTMELQRQQANRYQMALDESYYDSEQWTPAEAAEVRSRGQNPVVYNEVAPMVDFLIGTEVRARTDYEIMARNDDSLEAAYSGDQIGFKIPDVLSLGYFLCKIQSDRLVLKQI